MTRSRRRQHVDAAPSPVVSDSRFSQAVLAAGLEPLEGKTAIKGEYRARVDASAGSRFVGSVDMDAAFVASEAQASRWDYGVGIHKDGQELAFWIEPHPASSTSEVGRMLRMLDWIESKLREPAYSDLRRLTGFARRTGLAFHWLAMTGAIRIVPNSQQAKQLAMRGLSQPRRYLRLP